MSFGSPTPVEVAVQGPAWQPTAPSRRRSEPELRKLDFLRDLQYAQALDYPTLDIDDRPRARRTVWADHVGRGPLPGRRHLLQPLHRSELLARSGERQRLSDPGRDPAEPHGVVERRAEPSGDADGGTRPLLADIADLKLGTMPGEIERYNGQRVVSLTANIHGKPLGQAAAEIRAAIASRGRSAPRRDRQRPRPDPAARTDSRRSATGLALSRRRDLPAARRQLPVGPAGPGVVLTMPAVLCGVLAFARVDGHYAERPVVHGRDHGDRYRGGQLDPAGDFRRTDTPDGHNGDGSRREGATDRLRAVLMTATAMIAGMIPMALGSAQTAPLGRAVIGGLIAATVATLLVLPALYAILQSSARAGTVSLDPSDPESRWFESR